MAEKNKNFPCARVNSRKKFFFRAHEKIKSVAREKRAHTSIYFLSRPNSFYLLGVKNAVPFNGQALCSEVHSVTPAN